MKKTGLVLMTLLLLGFLSCSNKDQVLSLSKMRNLLLDLHIAEAYAQHLPKDSLQKDLKNKDSIMLWNASILKKHQVTEATFSKSMNWYKQHPELLDSIYQQMLSELTIIASHSDQ